MARFDDNECTGWVDFVIEDEEYRKNTLKKSEKRVNVPVKGKKRVL